MKNRPGLKQYIFAALGIVILVLLDQYTKLLAIAHLKENGEEAFLIGTVVKGDEGVVLC